MAEENIDVEEELDGSSYNATKSLSDSDSKSSDSSQRRKKQRKAFSDDRDVKRVRKEEERIHISQS